MSVYGDSGIFMWNRGLSHDPIGIPTLPKAGPAWAGTIGKDTMARPASCN